MIDDMQGLFLTARDAYLAGKREGVNEALRIAGIHLSRISSELEIANNTEGFHAAEKCCAILRGLKSEMET
jgi:hypothetical protein